MTLTRDYGIIKFECDDCGDELETTTDSFDVANKIRASEDWKIDTKRGKWRHLCPTCGKDVDEEDEEGNEWTA